MTERTDATVRRVGAVLVAMSLVVSLTRGSRADEPVPEPSALELLLGSAGFTLGAELPVLIARCSELGATLVRAPNDMMRCAIPATETRLPMRASLARMPGQAVLGYAATSLRAPTAEALLGTYEEARSALVARYRSVATEVEPRACASAAGRARCLREGTLESIQHMWSTGASMANGRPRGDAARLRAENTEDLTLTLQPSSEEGWQLVLTRTLTGYTSGFLEQATSP